MSVGPQHEFHSHGSKSTPTWLQVQGFNVGYMRVCLRMRLPYRWNYLYMLASIGDI